MPIDISLNKQLRQIREEQNLEEQEAEYWLKADFFCPDCHGTHPLNQCPLKGICLFCKIRPATLHFGDALSISHGWTEHNCCEICCVSMQVEHAEEKAKELPKLKKKLKKLLLKDPYITFEEK